MQSRSGENQALYVPPCRAAYILSRAVLTGHYRFCLRALEYAVTDASLLIICGESGRKVELYLVGSLVLEVASNKVIEQAPTTVYHRELAVCSLPALIEEASRPDSTSLSFSSLEKRRCPSIVPVRQASPMMLQAFTYTKSKSNEYCCQASV